MSNMALPVVRLPHGNEQLAVCCSHISLKISGDFWRTQRHECDGLCRQDAYHASFFLAFWLWQLFLKEEVSLAQNRKVNVPRWVPRWVVWVRKGCQKKEILVFSLSHLHHKHRRPELHSVTCLGTNPLQPLAPNRFSTEVTQAAHS